MFLLLLHVLYWLTYYYRTFPFGRKSALLRTPALRVTSLLWSTPLTYTYTSWSTQWNKIIFLVLIFRLYSVDCNRPGTRHSSLVWPKLFAVVLLLLLHLLPMHGVMYQDRIDWDQWNKLPRKTNLTHDQKGQGLGLRREIWVCRVIKGHLFLVRIIPSPCF